MRGLPSCRVPPCQGLILLHVSVSHTTRAPLWEGTPLGRDLSGEGEGANKTPCERASLKTGGLLRGPTLKWAAAAQPLSRSAAAMVMRLLLLLSLLAFQAAGACKGGGGRTEENTEHKRSQQDRKKET